MKRFLIFMCALFAFGACDAAMLNVLQNGNKTKILLDTTQRTTPALAVRIDESIYYANMETGCISGDVCVSYAGKQYSIQDNSKYAFLITTTQTTSRFSFSISAAGRFTIDWGDGTAPQEIVKTNTTNQTYSHTYMKSDIYKIGLDGAATGYSTDINTAAISFKSNTNLAKIGGSLGAIFSTLDNGNQPRFPFTFMECTSLSGKIPPNLFAGINGAPISHMFLYLFRKDSKLAGEIPANLFAGIKGQPKNYMFESLFYGCSGLTGSIPENLFAGIQGAPATSLFLSTFYGCSGLTGSIPKNLFAGIKGAPAEGMFRATFLNCSGLTGSIPYGLFGNLYGPPITTMFSNTFANCTGLTGPTARMSAGTRLYDVMYNGKTWYEQMPAAFTDMYMGSGIISDL